MVAYPSKSITEGQIQSESITEGQSDQKASPVGPGCEKAPPVGGSAAAAWVGAAAVGALTDRWWLHALFELFVVWTSHIDRAMYSIWYALKASTALYRTTQPVHQVGLRRRPRVV
jgi:hypothetical protein